MEKIIQNQRDYKWFEKNGKFFYLLSEFLEHFLYDEWK